MHDAVESDVIQRAAASIKLSKEIHRRAQRTWEQSRELADQVKGTITRVNSAKKKPTNLEQQGETQIFIVWCETD